MLTIQIFISIARNMFIVTGLLFVASYSAQSFNYMILIELKIK